MNKADLIDKISEKSSLPKNQINKMLDLILAEIESALKNNQSVNLRGFGVFKVKLVPARKYNNPKTGELMLVEKRQTVTFKPFKNLSLDQ